MVFAVERDRLIEFAMTPAITVLVFVTVGDQAASSL